MRHTKIIESYVNLLTKGTKNFNLIKELMEITFRFRRQQLLNKPKRVETILEEYPALQLITEVCIEVVLICSIYNDVWYLLD